MGHRKSKISQRVAANVKAKRKLLQLSQEELADRCRLHRTYVGAIERGERNITVETLDKLARALGSDPADLLREVGR
jgi:transcriptional regulator with XRE-family HTH domain